MIINTLELKTIANKILPAVDSSEISKTAEVLELETIGDSFYISVANREYSVTVKIYIGYPETLHASVNANLFLNLVSQTTTEEIELEAKDTYLLVKGNGSYKLPLLYDGDKMLTLTKVTIENTTVSMDIESDILKSILKYNSKEIAKNFVASPIQKMYYVDENGAITFTTGACVNKFKLAQPVRMLLSAKIVKLFKLFTGNTVHFTLGYDPLSNSIIQTKVCFEDNQVSLAAILQCDDAMLRSVPVKKILSRVETIYPYSVTINKAVLMQAINRLILLSSKVGNGSIFAEFEFSDSQVTIRDPKGDNTEVVDCSTPNPTPIDYAARFDLNDIKNVLSSRDEQYLKFNFGDGEALVVMQNSIFNVIPECPENLK